MLAVLLSGSRHCFKCAMCVNSLNLRKKTVACVPASSIPAAGMLKQGTKAKPLPRMSQAVSAGAGRETQTASLQSLGLQSLCYSVFRDRISLLKKVTGRWTQKQAIPVSCGQKLTGRRGVSGKPCPVQGLGCLREAVSNPILGSR